MLLQVAEASLLALPDDVRAAAAALEHQVPFVSMSRVGFALGPWGGVWACQGCAQEPHIQFVAAKLLLKIHGMPTWEIDNSMAALPPVKTKIETMQTQMYLHDTVRVR